MSMNNPYAITDDNVAAIDAPLSERVVFIRKTYATLFAGILGFIATLVAAGRVPAIGNMARGLFEVSPFLPLGLMIVGAIAVHALARKPGINMIVFGAYVFLFGLLMAPLINMLAGSEAGRMVITQAGLLTGTIFGGLTAYVFVTKKDFSFLGGILSVALIGMLAVSLIGAFTGFTPGLWYSLLGVLVFSGFILYDTSNILHRYPTDGHVGAAAELFVDIVLLFKHLIFILLSTLGDD